MHTNTATPSAWLIAGALPWGEITTLAAALPWIDATTPGPHSCTDAAGQAGIQGPVFWRGAITLPPNASASASYLKVSHPPDLLKPNYICSCVVQVTGWGHGFAAVNGFNLGRFSCKGPQEALFVPAAVLRPGSTAEVLIFEVDFNAATNCTPVWGAASASGPRSVAFVASASWTSEGVACP